MITSEQVTEIFQALVKAQAAVSNAPKTAENPYFNSRYADLAGIISVSRKPLSDNDLAVIQSPTTGDGKVTVSTRIIHKSGQWIEDSLSFEVGKKDPQSVGSAITYGRRYSLASMLGIAQEDDDGNAGSAPSKTITPEKETPKPKGTLYTAVNAIKNAKTLQDLNAIKIRIPKSSWSEQEELTIADAITTIEQSLKEGEK